MQSKRIAISAELHQKLIEALAMSLGIRQNLAEKSLETFLSDVLERLADEPSLLKELLSSSRGRPDLSEHAG